MRSRELDEVVAGARQHRAHAGLGIDLVRELLRDRERDVLLARARLADRARVLAAVAGVDRDDEVALPVAARNLDRHGRRRRQLVAEVHDEAIAIGLVRRRQESLGLDLVVDVEDDAQPMPAALADAHGLHDARGRGQLERLEVGVDRIEIDDDALGTGEREERISSREP